MKINFTVNLQNMIAEGLEDAVKEAIVDVPLNQLTLDERLELGKLMAIAQHPTNLADLRYSISFFTGYITIGYKEITAFKIDRPNLESVRAALNEIITECNKVKQEVKERIEEENKCSSRALAYDVKRRLYIS